jgi:transcriptional regulator with XRE-family HTH domain
MKNIRTIRLSKGLSQKALGKKTDLSQAAISRIESGIQEPGYRTVLRIALALGCDDPADLIGSPSPGPTAPAASKGTSHAA